MKTRMGPAFVAFVTLFVPSAVEAQVGRVGVREMECREGVPQGDLGIAGLDCRGECTLTMNERGEEQAWSFTVEPRISGITSGGPADGLLQVGDVLVAIGGVPITTRNGGIRYANIEPGQEVDLMIRRQGQLRRVSVRAGSVCPPPPKALPTAPVLPGVEPVPADTALPLPARGIAVGRLAPPLPPDTTVEAPRRAVGVAVSPRVVVAPERVAAGVADRVVGERIAGRVGIAGAATASAGLLAGTSPTGRLGIGFQCKECGTRTDETTGENVWFFSGPLEVTAVNSGGPADVAGIRRGDFIKAIDGEEIDTEEGGLAFTRITPGKAVRLTVVKRNGSEVDVSLVPEEATAVGMVRGRAVGPEGAGIPVRGREPAGVASRVPAARPAVPDVAPVPEPITEMAAPAGMPLRYSGTINGVEVEVRGEPVTVSEFGDTRTLYINAEGLWIKIRVPGRVLIRDGGTSSSGGSTRR